MARRIAIALGFEAGSSQNTGIGRYTQDLYDDLRHHPDVSAVHRFANFSWLAGDVPEAIPPNTVFGKSARSAAPEMGDSHRRWLDRANHLVQRVTGGETVRRRIRDALGAFWMLRTSISTMSRTTFRVRRVCRPS